MTGVFAINFPRDVRPAVMEPLLLRLHGLLRAPTLLRTGDRLAIELVGTPAGVRVQVGCEPEWLGRQVRDALEHAFVGGTIEPAPAELPATETIARISLGSNRAPLRVTREGGGLAGLLAPLGRLTGPQAGLIQFVLSAAPLGEQGRLLAASRPRGGSARSPLDSFLAASSDHAIALREKAATPLFRVSVAVAASSATLCTALVAGFRQFAGPAALPRPRFVRCMGRTRRQVVSRRHSRFPLSVTVGAGELAAVLGPEAAALRAAGGPVLAARRLPPPAEVPARGRVLAVSNAGPERPIALTAQTARTHSVFVGPTSCGKTTALVRQCLAAAEENAGVVLVEPLKAGGIESFLTRLPEPLCERVVLLDPELERDFPPAINFLDRAPGQDIAGVANSMLGVLRAMHPDLGQRTADVLYNALYLAAAAPDGTLADLPRLLMSREARADCLRYVHDPFVRGFFEEFDRRSEPDQLNIAAPAIGRLRPLLRPELAPIVGQPTSTIDIDGALATRRILLVRVPMGAELFGALIIDRIWRATLRRATHPEASRPDTLLAVDEAPAFLKIGVDAGEMLALARELRLSMVLATQGLTLCPPALRQALLINARTRLVWQTDESEAAVLGRGLAPALEPIDLVGLGEHEVAIRLAVGNATARPFTGRTPPLPEPLRTSTAEIRARSRHRYGRPRAEIEDELRQRLAPSITAIDPEAIGTRPR